MIHPNNNSMSVDYSLKYYYFGHMPKSCGNAISWRTCDPVCFMPKSCLFTLSLENPIVLSNSHGGFL